MVVNNSGQGALGAGMGNATIANPAQQPSALGQIGAGLGDIFSGLMGAGQSILSSPDALTGIAGGLLTKEAYDRLSDIGEQMITGTTIDGQRVPGAMEIAERGQAESQFKPFTVTTPTGAMFTARMGGQPTMPRQTMPVTSPGGFAPSPTAPPSMMLPPSDQLIRPGDPGYQVGGPAPSTDARTEAFFQQLQQQLKDSGYQPPGLKDLTTPLTDELRPRVSSPYDGIDDEMRSRLGLDLGAPLPTGPFLDATSYMPRGEPQPTTDGLQIGMQLSPQEQALQQQLLGGAGGFFGQAVQPTVDREQAIFERIRAAQRPEEERQRLALEERLAAQGRLGTSSAAYGGATPELLALSTAEREARDRSMLTAMQQAQAEQAQQAALGQQFLGAGYLPTQQLVAATQPGLIQQELAQQAQQFGTGLFGETALSGLEAQLIAEQARANLLGGIGSNVISGLINQQRAASAAPSGGGSSLGGLFSTVAGGLGQVGQGIKDLLRI